MDVKKIMVGIIGILSSVTVMAAGEVRDFEVTPDFANNTVTVSGDATVDDNITIMVLKDGVTPGTVWGNLSTENTNVNIAGSVLPSVKADTSGVVFHINDDITVGENGKFTYEFTFNTDGTYDVYVCTSEGIKEYQNLSFASSTSYNSAIDSLNDALSDKNKNEFVSLLKNAEVRKTLGMDEDFDSNADSAAAAELMYESLVGGQLAYDYAENKALYDCCAAITAVKAGYNATEYLRYSIADDETACKWYDKYVTTEAAEKFIAQKLKNNTISDIDELSDELKSAIVLYVVYSPDGYENIKKAFEDFEDVTGVTSPVSKLKVYSELAGKSFDDMDKLIDKYEELADKYSSSSGGGGGGGGGGSSSSSGSSGGGASLGIGAAAAVMPNVQQTSSPEPMNTNIFTDLDSVPWAEDAIVELAVKGVISGKTDTTFCPNDYITREEFTKLVAEAFAGDVEGAEINFNDVPKSRWSYPYISKAKAAGLISGYSDTQFGATDLISRQDMAVIIYNAAIYKNVALGSAEDTLTFGDDAYIADYAREAVYTLKSMGIINGVSDVEFAPTRNATRAEAAVIIYAMLLK